jgi:hypothetical protein
MSFLPVRFMQHVLAKGLVKVRYYVNFNPGLHTRLTHLGSQLDGLQLDHPTISQETLTSNHPTAQLFCPSSGQVLLKIKTIPADIPLPP